nr:hypothetical protein [Piscirickettsia salmonis]
MERRHAHAGLARQLLDVQILRVGRVDAPQRPRHLAEMPLHGEGRAHRRALVAGQDLEVDLAHQRRAEDPRFHRAAHRLEEPQHRLGQARAHRAGQHAFRLCRRDAAQLVDLQHQIGRQLEIQVHVDGQERLLLAGVGFHREGHGHRDDQAVARIVKIGVAAEVAALAALAHDHDAGVVQHRHGLQRAVRAQQAHVGQRRQVVALVGRQRLQQGDRALAHPRLRIVRLRASASQGITGSRRRRGNGAFLGLPGNCHFNIFRQ